MSFTKIDITGQSFNPFDLIGNRWMLISAGTEESWNTMTASWGGIGVMWRRPSATCYIRQSRYTKQFVDAGEYFTLTFLKDGHRDALNLLGTKSGRDIDKMHASGLTPVFVDGQPTFEEADLVIICRKRGAADIPLADIDEGVVRECYPEGDHHTMYIGEIVAAYRG